MISAPPLAVSVSGMPAMVTESRPTNPPSTMPVPTKTMSVAVVGRSAYPSSFAARSTSALGADQAQHVSADRYGYWRRWGSLARLASDCAGTPHARTPSRASSASVFPTTERLGDHDIQCFDRDIEQSLVVHFGTDPGRRARTCTSCRAMTATTSSR